MKSNFSLIAAAVLGVLPLAGLPACAADYKLLMEIPVGGAGGFDYLTVDPDARRLYVSHGTKAVVIDLEANKVVGEIADTPGIHGVAIATDLGIGYTSNGREAKASMFDLKTLATKQKVETGLNPDAILYEPGKQEIYTFNGRGNSATVIEAKTGKVVATIPLSGKPETGVADPKAGRVYNNIETKNEIAVIDTATHTVVTNWPIAPGGEAAGMAIDLEHHRLFVGCHLPEAKPVMEMLDSATGKIVASVPIGTGTDATAFDPGTQLAFSSCGDGTVTIAHEDSPDKLTVVQTLTTARGARTMTVDSKTHRIYLVTGQNDTFKVLVYGM
jgi:YVTN family beta-propeller protein